MYQDFTNAEIDDLAERLENYQARYNLTFAELAAGTGIAASTLCRFINRISDRPRRDTIHRIARFLADTVDEEGPMMTEELSVYLRMARDGEATANQYVIDAMRVFGLVQGLPERRYRLTEKGRELDALLDGKERDDGEQAAV